MRKKILNYTGVNPDITPVNQRSKIHSHAADAFIDGNIQEFRHYNFKMTHGGNKIVRIFFNVRKKKEKAIKNENNSSI